jgi:hypothetical protein
LDDFLFDINVLRFVHADKQRLSITTGQPNTSSPTQV